ncbi:unnamed protein product [Trifolium pratense]|uniref:Uncharacterized protein n=1 Tax=Trifolium pratense TaxID=57577 RepID=A0ACB0LTY2_TRIPR|nr:unnamed protein product [Trifolium pratense]
MVALWSLGNVEERGWLGNNISSIFGDGKNLDFWKEKWIGMAPLRVLFPSLFNKSTQQDGYASDMGNWDNDIWSWKLVWTDALIDTEVVAERDFYALLEHVQPNRINSDRRKLLPNSAGFFSVRSTYEVQQSRIPVAALDPQIEATLKLLWLNKVPSKVCIFGCRLLLEKLPTREALYRGGIITNTHERVVFFASKR